MDVQLVHQHHPHSPTTQLIYLCTPSTIQLIHTTLFTLLPHYSSTHTLFTLLPHYSSTHTLFTLLPHNSSTPYFSPSSPLLIHPHTLHPPTPQLIHPHTLHLIHAHSTPHNSSTHTLFTHPPTTNPPNTFHPPSHYSFIHTHFTLSTHTLLHPHSPPPTHCSTHTLFTHPTHTQLIHPHNSSTTSIDNQMKFYCMYCYRTSGVTSANQHSSRSHAVFQLLIRTR